MAKPATPPFEDLEPEAPLGGPTPDAARVREMSVQEFVRRLRPGKGTERRFAIFLGAGCSVTSGIPAARVLVQEHWLPRLRDVEAPDRTNLSEWAKEAIEGYDPESPADSYGKLIDRLFVTPEERQREIELLCDGRTPSFGYAVLAQLVALPEGRFNVVLTTNFDDMVADALYLYTDARPLVIHHESLAAFIRPTRTRPLVIKLHGDHRLSPRNTALETQSLEQEIREHTAMVLHDRGLIFIGYGGADRGIHQLLDGLPRQAVPYGAYWVHPEPPQGPIRAWLAARGGIWVRSGYFDEVMLQIRNAFNLPHPAEDRFKRIFADYHAKWLELSSAIQARPASTPEAKTLKSAVETTEASFPDYWKAIAAARRLEESAPDQADELYRRAIEQFPTASSLLGTYAVFINDIRRDADTADAMYKRAVAADPKHANNLGNYALFLKSVRRDYDGAEAMYKRALAADPKHANNLGNYASFLTEIRRNHDAAEAMFKRALDADPKHAYSLGNYAVFLSQIRKDQDAAEAMYKRALEADHRHAGNIGNYALFLADIRKDQDAAEAMYKRALVANPRNAHSLGNYALFLHQVRQDHDTAEALYKRATQADPRHANNLGNYAAFLAEVRKDHDGAEDMYKRALEADPRHANNVGNYATFLERIRKNQEAAEDMYKRALEVDPNHANNLGNYAGFLLARGRDAEGMAALERALPALDPKKPHAVECWFYMYAHGPQSRRVVSLAMLNDLLVRTGTRSPGWDLTANIARATKDGHPEAAWLPKLAAVIGGEAEPASLRGWPAWKAADKA